jgi:hypothetical protein
MGLLRALARIYGTLPLLLVVTLVNPMNCLRHALFVMLALFAVGARSADVAVIEQLRAPAWLDRAGVSVALRPGESLQAGDRIRTGPDARVSVRLTEGSRIKLGADAQFAVASLEGDAKKSVKGALEMVYGAFRFSTDLLRKNRTTRDVSIKVATATIGIRGTDVWGRAGANRDLVALIEGRIELSREGKALEIAPMQFLDAPHGEAAQVRVLEPAVLETLAQETEIVAKSGVSGLVGRNEGRWALRVGSAKTRSALHDMNAAVNAAGYAAHVLTIGVAAQRRYELRIDALLTREDAQALAVQLHTQGIVSETPTVIAP